ncbi:hypothetical protein WT01_36300 [Burkholderia cepacia]|nr:hypothetical protein WT01_36300 [Burkholderia cepacia]
MLLPTYLRHGGIKTTSQPFSRGVVQLIAHADSLMRFLLTPADSCHDSRYTAFLKYMKQRLRLRVDTMIELPLQRLVRELVRETT